MVKINNDLKLYNFDTKIIIQELILLLILPLILLYLNYNIKNNILYYLCISIYVLVIILLLMLTNCIHKIKDGWCFVFPLLYHIPLVILYVIYFTIYILTKK
jgi:hypothetical protein